MLTTEEPASPNAIQIVPGSEYYAAKTETLMATVYNFDPHVAENGLFTTAHFLNHLAVFSIDVLGRNHFKKSKGYDLKI